MSLALQLAALIAAVGPDIKALQLADGNLAALTTTAKGNLVSAINEVHAALAAAGAIDDASGDGIVNKTWSANKIFDEIAAAKIAVRDELRAGAGAALDTFAEVAAQLAADETAAAALATAVALRLRVDAPQGLSAPQQTQARSNIGAASAIDVGDTEQDLAALYVAAKA